MAWLLIALWAWVIFSIMTAPTGYEDENGFHITKSKINIKEN